MSPSKLIVAILYPGSMGWSLAERLRSVGRLTIWSDLSKRSQATRDRATQAGIEDVPLERIVAEAGMIISVLPPSEAPTLAKQVLALVKADQDSRPIYVDANAIAPSTVTTLSKLVSPHLPLISASIIGGPASTSYLPTLYAAASPANQAHLNTFLRLNDNGLKVKTLDGPEEGAKALKMGYAGLNKGLTGLGMAMVLSTHAYSPSTSAALLEELALSNPTMLGMLSKQIVGAVPKAYRWVGEMEEIATFVQEASSSSISSPRETTKDDLVAIYRGMAATFERVARDLEHGGSTGGKGEGGKDVRVLEEWCAEGQRKLANK